MTAKFLKPMASFFAFGIGAALPLIIDSPKHKERLETARDREVRVTGCGIDAYYQLPKQSMDLSNFLEQFDLPLDTTAVRLDSVKSEQMQITITLNGLKIRGDAWYNHGLNPGDTLWLLGPNGQPGEY